MGLSVGKMWARGGGRSRNNDDRADAEDNAARTRARQSWTVVVDGETFTIKPTDEGGWGYDWVSDPKEGYGFGRSRIYTTDDPSAPLVELTRSSGESIRNFLLMINPETAYID